MITPTRFGLKYAPIPTLALEYEEDLKSIDDVSGSRSLYIYKEESERHPTPKKWKRVHVVELPQLTRQSEPQTIIQQLQRDNQRFLGPDVVKEEQLKRLLLQLMSRLQGTDRHVTGASAPVAAKPDEHEVEEEEEELEASAMEESVVEASAELEASSDDPPPRFDATQDLKPTTYTVSRGQFNTHEESDDEPPHDAEHLKPNEAEDEDEDEEEEQEMPPEKPAAQSESPTKDEEEDTSDHEEDEKKKKALKSESEVSDEEDIQSEELEYFSEDGSDEDSF